MAGLFAAIEVGPPRDWMLLPIEFDRSLLMPRPKLRRTPSIVGVRLSAHQPAKSDDGDRGDQK